MARRRRTVPAIGPRMGTVSTSGNPSVVLVARHVSRRGGVGRCTLELAERSDEWDVTMVCERADDMVKPVGVQRVDVPGARLTPGWLKGAAFTMFAAKGLRDPRRLVHSQEPLFTGADIYTAHSCFNAYIAQERAVAGRAAALASRMYPPHQFTSRWSRYCSRRSSVVIAVSKQIKRELVTYHGLDPNRVEVIYNGVDLSHFQPLADRDAARRALARQAPEIGRDLDRVVGIFVGHEFRRKGFGTILRALATLPHEERPVIWAVGGARADPYQKMAARLGVGESVRFLGRQGNIAAWLGAADVFVFPTFYEAASLAVLEALAAGLPIITTNTAMAGEILTDGREGRLIEDPRDAAELGDAIRGLATSRQMRMRMGAEARRTALLYSWDRMAAETHAVWAEVANAKLASVT